MGLWFQNTALGCGGCTPSPLPAGYLRQTHRYSSQTPEPTLDLCGNGCQGSPPPCCFSSEASFPSPPCPRLFSSLQEAPGTDPSPGQHPALLGTRLLLRVALGVARGTAAGCGWGQVPGDRQALSLQGGCRVFPTAGGGLSSPGSSPQSVLHSSLLLAVPPSNPACPLPPQCGTPTHKPQLWAWTLRGA